MSTISRSPLSSQSSSSSVSPPKRKAMSITQTYYLAHTARGKLSSEASRADHNLRLLVGHANLLDSLMLELAEAEQEQESWFNQSVKGANKTEQSPKHIQWADAVIEEPEEDWQVEDAESDSDSDSEFDDEEDVKMDAATTMVSLHRVSSRPIPSADYESDEEIEDDGEEDYAALTLTLTQSHSSSHPPELSHDSDEESSEDESMPPSPPSASIPSFTEKQRQQIATTSYYANSSSQPLSLENQAEFQEKGYFLPQRAAPSGVTSISVY